MTERIRIADARKLASPLPDPPMLITECSDDFDRICVVLNKEIRPRGFVEKMYVADIAQHTWDILRVRRWKAAVINSESRAALEIVVDRLLCQSETAEQRNDWRPLKKRWFTDKAAKRKLSELLRKLQLDESAIEAEAFMRVAPEVERLDRMMALYESRRSKAFRNIAESDLILAQRLRVTSERIIEGKALAIEDKVSDAASSVA